MSKPGPESLKALSRLPTQHDCPDCCGGSPEMIDDDGYAYWCSRCASTGKVPPFLDLGTDSDSGERIIIVPEYHG